MLIMVVFLANAQYSPITINSTGTVVNTNATVTFTNKIVGIFSGDGAGLTNIPYVKTFTSTNLSFIFTQNTDGTTNVALTITNLAGLSGSSSPVTNYALLTVTNGTIDIVSPLSYVASSNVTVNFSLAQTFTLLLTNNAFLTITNLVATSHKSYTIKTKQNATGGYSVTWITNQTVPWCKFSGGVSPTATTNANAEDIWTIEPDYSGTNAYVVLSPNFR